MMFTKWRSSLEKSAILEDKIKRFRENEYKIKQLRALVIPGEKAVPLRLIQECAAHQGDFAPKSALQ